MQINHSTWNFRNIPVFDEEIVETETPLTGVSISGFQEKSFYTDAVREKLVLYIHSCIPIVASTFERKNVYTKEIIYDLVLYTDGQVIFDNLLLSYIKQDDFVIPDRWYKIISDNDFILDDITIDFEKKFEENIDIFTTVEETFDQSPTIAKVIQRVNRQS